MAERRGLLLEQRRGGQHLDSFGDRAKLPDSLEVVESFTPRPVLVTVMEAPDMGAPLGPVI